MSDAVGVSLPRGSDFCSTLIQESAFVVFDKDGNGDISKREMRDAVRRIYKERRAITASLKVTKVLIVMC